MNYECLGYYKYIYRILRIAMAVIHVEFKISVQEAPNCW